MTQYQAVFRFSKELPENFKNLVISDFVNLRGKAVEELNKHYEEWNNEFKLDMRIPGVKFLYNKFIAKHQREVLAPFNAKAEKNPLQFTILDVDKEGDLIGRLKAAPNITIQVELIPIEIEA